MALIQALQDDSKGHSTKLDEVAALVGDGMQEDRMRQSHAALESRLALLHQSHGDTAQQHSKELSALRDSHAAHASRVAGHAKLVESLHATIPERLSYLEQMLGDSADEHNSKLETALAKVDSLHSRVSACETQGTVLDKNHESLARDKEAK